MGVGTLSILSLLPIIAVAVFLVGLRWPASKAMPISYLVAAILAPSGEKPPARLSPWRSESGSILPRCSSRSASTCRARFLRTA